MDDTQPTLPGFGGVSAYGADLIDAAIVAIEKAVQYLRDAGAIQPQHEGQVALIYVNLDSAKRSKMGIARANFVKEASRILEALPEPLIEESSDVVDYELDRIRKFYEQLAEARADPADVPDEAQPAQV